MKNGWKKTLSLLLCLVLLAGLFPAALAEGEMCTVTFSTDGGHYLNPITAEKDSEITLPKAVWDDHYFLGWSLEYNGTVAYQAGDTLVLTEDTSLYAIWRDSQPLGLYAYWADTGESYAETTVPLNGSITLRVEAGVSAGELSYEWSCYGMDPSLLPGESSNIFTIDVVDKHYTVECTVRDMEGNTKWLYYVISPDTGLWARAAGSGTNRETVSVSVGGSATLTVEAGVDLGGLRYEWHRADYPYTSFPDIEGNTLTLENVNERMRIYCYVYDDYGNNETVQFELVVDTGFWACSASSGREYELVSVPIGESVTLTVEAGVNTGELHSRWYRYVNGSSETLAQDVLTLTVDNIEQYTYIYCAVNDDYGNSKTITFQVSPDSGLWARAAGTSDTYAEITVKKGENVTLTVEAGVDVGDLHYEWYCEDLDPALLPTDDSTASITIPGVEKHCSVSCNVSDDYGNTEYISFSISTDTGLQAWAAGTNSGYVEYTIQKGDNVTLAVEARVDEGELRYRWGSSQQEIRKLLPQDEKTPSFTLENLRQPCYIYCNVYDDEGNSKNVAFRIYTDTGLTAYVAGTQTNYMEYRVPSGESVTLAVDARVNEGGLRYRWYCNDDVPAELPTDESTTSFTISKVEKSYEIRCQVFDDDGNSKTVFFDVYPDTGLKAWIEGADEGASYKEYHVPLGDSLTLSVKAETDGGNLHYRWDCFEGVAPGLPTDDQTSSFTITEVKGYAYIRCRVSDDLGGRVDLYMEVNVDTGLKAWIEGSYEGANYKNYSVPLGDSLTLSVKAETDGGNLHYRWDCFEGVAPGLPTDDQTSSFTITEVKGYAYIRCRVSDDLGGRVDLYMAVNVDNGLKAYAAGTERTNVYYFDSSAPQTLAVEASADQGDLTYIWRVRTRSDGRQQLSGDGPSLFVGPVTEDREYSCEVTDIYGNRVTVLFNFRPGMATALPLRTETTVASDPFWGELYVSFTPETTGRYALKRAADDPEAWCYCSEQTESYWMYLPTSFSLEAGKTYYFAINSDENAFTLHLTMDRSGFRTFEELQAMLETSISGDRLYYEGSDDPFVIPSDLTIPSGVYVYCSTVGVEIAANAVLTVEEGGLLYCDDLHVKGSAQNNGQISCSAVSGEDKIAYGEDGYLCMYATVETEEELRSAVEQAATKTNPHVYYDITATEAFTITRDLTIPSYTYLSFEGTVTLAPGVTLEISDSPESWIQIYGKGQLRVQGTLRNNGAIGLYTTNALVLENGGRYCGDGFIEAYAGYGKAKDYFPWAFEPEYSDYEITTEGNWYYLRKKIAAEPGDVNGDGSINSKDLLLLRKLLVGLPADDKIVAPDVNGDGSLDLRDLVRLRKLLAAQSAG